MSYISSLLEILMYFFNLNPKTDVLETKEYYRALKVDKKTLNDLKIIFEKEKCFYFSDFVLATADRKKIMESQGDIIISISVEPDYIY